MQHDYDIVMAEPAWDRFWQYTAICPGEVAAFGYCKLDEQLNAVYVDDLFLVPQEADSSQVDFFDKGLPYAIKKATEDDRIEDLRFCIHSHAQHGAMWSGTDEDMIEKIGLTGTPWFASVIFNKSHKTAGRVDLFASSLPLPGLRQATIEADVLCENQVGLYEECIAEVEQFVKKPKPKQITTGWANGKPTGNGKPGVKDDSERHVPALNMADLIEYDDDVMLDMTTGEYYQLDRSTSKLHRMHDDEIQAWLKDTTSADAESDHEMFKWGQGGLYQGGVPLD